MIIINKHDKNTSNKDILKQENKIYIR